jgi:hypothetical protein
MYRRGFALDLVVSGVAGLESFKKNRETRSATTEDFEKVVQG